jgi:hypothetical protein
MTQQRNKVPDGSATAKAIDYNLKRWVALTRYGDDGALPIDRTGCSPDHCVRASAPRRS